MNKSYQWRIQLAVVLTSLGVLYYFVFLFYFVGGMPIERIHDHITDGLPASIADAIPYIAPTFLLVGLWFGYSYNQKRRPAVPAPQETEYKFEFNKVSESNFFVKPAQRRQEAGLTDNVDN